MAEQTGDKSHEATPHRREEARKKGQVAVSQDLGSAVILVAGVAILLILGGNVMVSVARLMVQQIGGDAWLTTDADLVMRRWHNLLSQIAATMLPVLGFLMLAAVTASLLQVGFLFVPARIALDPARINPLSGLQRLFSPATAMRLGFGLFKVAIIAAVAFVSLYDRWAEILTVGQRELGSIAIFMANITLWTCMKIGIALLLLAVLDYAYQRWKHENDLRMTQQEIREEMKNYQGDPQITARRRAVQRQLILNRMSDAVPKADVVITNPTELAIAIRYVPDEMAAPVVVAKGAGPIAQRIRRLALEHGIPVVEKKPLAQALYRDVDVNQPIPHKSYAAVAEVLAYVYQLKGKHLPTPPRSAA